MSHIGNDILLEQLLEKYIDLGFTEDEAEDLAIQEFNTLK